MTDQNPITPPPELVQQWVIEANEYIEQEEYAFATRAAQWSADQELEACLAEVSFLGSASLASKVRAARRPKPQTLKSDALFWLEKIERDRHYLPKVTDAIRDALERLDDA